MRKEGEEEKDEERGGEESLLYLLEREADEAESPR